MKKQLHQVNPLVVVADAARAQFFTVSAETRKLVERSTLINCAGRMRDQDLTSDVNGRSFDTGGAGRHAMGPSSSAKQNAAVSFAEEVAQQVPEQMAGLNVRDLILVATPRFLGQLRKVLPSSAQHALYFEINADYTTHSTDQITNAVNRRLRDA